MEPEYSSKDITAARSLQTYDYMYTSIAAFWTYDYICSLEQEWTYLFRSRWTRVKYLYIVTRYVPFLFFVSHLYMNFIDETSDKCHVLNVISEAISLISAVCSECFFILRTYALWNNNRIVLTAMVLFFIAIIIASIAVLFSSNVAVPFYTSVIPDITGCYQTSGTQLLISFVLLFVLGLGLLILTLIRAVRDWQTTTGPLYTVLLKHNIEYYACGLLFSLLNILASVFFVDAYSSMFHNFQLITLAILATRMHLYLWHMDQHLRQFEALVLTPISISIGH